MQKQISQLKDQLNVLVDKVKTAKSTRNFMLAKRLKDEIESEIEPLGREFFGAIESLAAQNASLQKQIIHLDERVSNLGG